MLNAQIDLETLGLESNAVIVQIGAIIYDDMDWNIVGTYGRYLSMNQQIVEGRTLTPSTVEFWKKQREDGHVTPERWEDLFNSPNPPAEVAVEFVEWFQQWEGVRIWANHLLFDVVKMDHFLSQFYQPKLSSLTKYNMMEDLATLKYAVLARDKIAGRDLIDGLYKEHKALTQHDAVDDCIFQMHCQRAFEDFLRG